MNDQYLDAKKQGDRAYRRAVLVGKYPYLPALDEIINPDNIQGETPLGMMEIPLDDIVGTKTKGRQQAFADNFMPLLGFHSEFAMKWADLYDSAKEEGIRDPILVYEYLHKFYVQEGNKRVSVMKYNGAVSIPAEVIRVLPVRSEEKENKIYYEFVEFFKYSGIYSITFSKLHSYEKLSELCGVAPTEIWGDELRRDVRAAFQRFRKQYLEKGGGKLENTIGDAFLIYLNIYGLQSLKEDSTGQINQHLDQLWNEFLKSVNELTLIKTPEETKKESASIFNVLTPLTPERKSPLKAAFLYEMDVQSSRWAYGHELGRNYISEKFSGRVESWKYENLSNSESISSAIDDAVKKGAEIIFTTSGNMTPETVKAAVHYPRVHFLNCTIHTSFNSIRTYYSRFYEAKFLMGALAASITEGNDIGYVELCPLYGTLANINAFSLGAQLVNPWARVHLQWSGLKNVDYAAYFKDLDIQTISGQELVRPDSPSREYGLYLYSAGDVVSNLAAAIQDWGKYYELIIRSVLEGSFSDNKLIKSHHALNYWYGLREGVIDIILSPDLSYNSRKLIDLLKREIVEEHRGPFHGELHSQTGIIQGEDAGDLSPEDIVNMRWLNDNVVGNVPKLSEFEESVQELIRTGGFLS